MKGGSFVGLEEKARERNVRVADKSCAPQRIRRDSVLIGLREVKKNIIWC